MIGASGSGKTCYLYAMYSSMALGVNGFTFAPADYDQALDLEEGWRLISSDQTWPPGSIESKDFIFDCCHSLRPMISFVWHDYRGGILTDRESAADRNALFQRLKNSSCLIMCIDAERLRLIISGQDHLTLGRYSKLLVDYVKANGRPVPVAITITKADMMRPDEIKKGVEVLKTSLDSALFQPDGNWLVLITAVTLGSAFENASNRKFTGTIAPKNVHLPVLFAIYATMSRYLTERQSGKSQAERDLSEAIGILRQEEKKGFFKRLWDGDRRSGAQEALGEIQARMERMQASIKGLESDLQRLVAQLRTDACHVFWNGKRELL